MVLNEKLLEVMGDDVKTVISEPCRAMMGTALAGGPDRATQAAEAAVACSPLEGIGLRGARRLAGGQTQRRNGPNGAA